MVTIHKFDVPTGPAFELFLPADAEPLCVQMQFDSPRIWVRLDPDAPRVSHGFAVVGTGNPCPPANVGRYLGTFQQYGGSLVWHVFYGGCR